MAWAMAIPAVMSAISGAAGQGMSAEEAARRREQARAVAEGIPDLYLPDENYSYLNYAGDYDPYSLGAPTAAEYKTVQEDPATRNIEMQALQRLMAQGDGSADAQNAAEQFQALDSANQQAAAREGAIRQQMERKGQGGSGLNAIMQAQAAQAAANRAKSGTLDAVSKAALMKLQAQQGALQGAGAVRGQDFNVARTNTDTINDFNRMNTQMKNQWHAQDVQNQNAAALRNLNTRQDIMGRNTGIANAGVDVRRGNAKAKYDAQVHRADSTINGINGQAAQANTNGQIWNQLGQQGQQLFTNIGSGISAAQNANRGDDSGEYDDPDRETGAFHSKWW